MLERLLFVLIALALGFAVYQVVKRRQMQQAAYNVHLNPLVYEAPSGVATIVYFTTPTCAPCKLQQTPTLERLQNELGERLHIVRIDASEDIDTASKWGVFSVPTTFVLDHTGNPRTVYNGVVDGETLKQALQV
jgi:thioredoxin-like negative regulator of GroEL